MTLHSQRGLQARKGPSQNRIDFVPPAEPSYDDSNRTVLFVDDEPSILTVRRLLFEAQGYSVLTAESGMQALTLMQTHLVDVVVLDYLMPEMDGEETALRIRELHGDVPIILSTGSGSVPPRVMELVTLLVHKGRDPQILLDAVERHTELSPKPESLANAAIHSGS